MSYDDDYDSEMRMCCVEPCETIIDTSHHEAQLCGRCCEYVCPEHQWTVDGDTWCCECASGYQGDAARSRTRKTSPGHGGAGQTVEGDAQKGNSPTPSAGDSGSGGEPGPGDGVTSPARVSDVERVPLRENPYERILLPNGGVRFRRRRPDPIEKLLHEVGREIDETLEDEDPGYQERARVRLFGGGGT